MFDGKLHIRQAFYRDSRELMPVYADQFTRCVGLQSSASSALIHLVYTQYITKSFYLKHRLSFEGCGAPTSGNKERPSRLKIGTSA